MLLKRNLLGITLFSLIISLICFCLSAWQVKRLFWKSDLINSLELAYKSSPANINNLYGDLREFKYKKILVEKPLFEKFRNLKIKKLAKCSTKHQPVES